MNKDTLITVVVPIYNVEKYLEKCLISIINQEYKNIEIILVNDGSTDRSGIVAENFKSKDDRIKVIHKANGGLSSARNAGLKTSHGEYIIFIDSDDIVSRSMIGNLYSLIKKYDCDISICSFMRFLGENEIAYYNKEEPVVLNNMEALNKLYDEKYMTEFVVAWNKLYNIKLFDDIIYPDGKIHEDEFTTYKLLFNSRRVVYTPQILYYYRVTPNSIMNGQFNQKRLHVLEAFEERVIFAKKVSDDIFYQNTLRRYLDLCIDCYAKANKYLDDEECINQIKSKAKDVYMMYMDTKPKTNIHTLRYKAFFVNYMIYRCLNKCINIF